MARIRKSILALLLGWVAGTTASLPFALYEVVRNTEGNWTLMVASLGYGLTLWVIWTLGIAIVAGVGAALPIAVLIKAQTLLRFRILTVIVSGVVAGGVVIATFWGAWYLASGELAALLEYFVFTVVFAVVTAEVYLRKLRAANEQTVTSP